MANNTSERLCKISAVGRNNYLFVGKEQADQAAALHYSMASSAKAHGVEAFRWLRACYEGLPYLYVLPGRRSISPLLSWGTDNEQRVG